MKIPGRLGSGYALRKTLFQKSSVMRPGSSANDPRDNHSFPRAP